MRSRGVLLVDAQDKALHAKSDADGVTLFRFTFHHQ
jgi:hypothetical protein